MSSRRLRDRSMRLAPGHVRGTAETAPGVLSEAVRISIPVRDAAADNAASNIARPNFHPKNLRADRSPCALMFVYRRVPENSLAPTVASRRSFKSAGTNDTRKETGTRSFHVAYTLFSQNIQGLLSGVQRG